MCWIKNKREREGLRNLCFSKVCNMEFYNRCFWFLSIIGSTILLTFSINRSFEKFDNCGIVTLRSNEAIDIGDIPFPAFTFCNDRSSIRQPLNFTYAQQLSRSNLDTEK